MGSGATRGVERVGSGARRCFGQLPHEWLNAHGLGERRGVPLCGPPGTGKSAVSAVVAAEVVGGFTVTYVEAKAGAELLTAVVEEAQHLGGPVLLVLEDVDLWCRDRSIGGGETVDAAAVVAALPEHTSGSDLREIVRRTVITTDHNGDLSTAAPLAEVCSGRYRAVVPEGMYL